jgi:acyl-coenzyme A thioesterase PaaI-like protein
MMGNVDMNVPAPPGYSALLEMEGYIALSGPYFWAKNVQGDFTYDNRHGNPNGVLHGAAMVTFVDTILGHIVVATTGHRCATIALDSQFVAAIRTGQWIDGRTRIRKLTKTLAFLDAEASSGETLLLTATAIFRIFPGAETSLATSGSFRPT